MFFDWLTPLASLLTASGKDRFAVHNYEAARAVLKRHGINTRLPGETDGLWVFDVDAGKGVQAETILRQAGLL